MKRFIFALLCVLMVVAFTGCASIKGIKDAINSVKSLVDESDDNSDTGDTQFEYGEDYITSHLGDEYSIKYSLTSYDNGQASNTYTVALSKNEKGYYVDLGGGAEYMYIKEGDVYVMCVRDEESSIFKKVSLFTMSEEEVKTSVEATLGYMAYYSYYTDNLEKDGTATVCGRTCVKYKLKSYGWGASSSLVYYIDKETGVCMKYEAAIAAGGEYGSFTFECIEFSLSNVKLPAYSD